MCIHIYILYIYIYIHIYNHIYTYIIHKGCERNMMLHDFETGPHFTKSCFNRSANISWNRAAKTVGLAESIRDTMISTSEASWINLARQWLWIVRPRPKWHWWRPTPATSKVYRSSQRPRRTKEPIPMRNVDTERYRIPLDVRLFLLNLLTPQGCMFSALFEALENQAKLLDFHVLSFLRPKA